MSDGTHVSQEMPRYKCHKEVWALKIERVDAAKCVIHPADDGYGPYPVSREYLKKHKPGPGGYYVLYEDGYESFSPAEAFEDGYTRIT